MHVTGAYMGYIYPVCLLVSECECVSHVSESNHAVCESDESARVDALFCMPQNLCQLESERLTLVINI